MIIKHKHQRVGVFIDTQNLYHSARNLHNARVHFGTILEKAVAHRELIRAVAYVITTESGEERGFFDALTKMGIETKTKDLQIFGSGAMKADWDVGLAVDAIKLAPKLDAVILLSGDGDFVPLVEYLKTNQGCQVEVVSFGKSTSSRLIEIADDFLDLDINPREYLIGPGNDRRIEQAAPATAASAPTLMHRPREDRRGSRRIVRRRLPGIKRDGPSDGKEKDM
jgi:uncharacterized LabA/DUF88 family protein